MKKPNNTKSNRIVTFFRNNWILCCILLVAVGLRFWDLFARIGYGGDSIRDAFVAMYGSEALQLPLTGPFSSLGPFTFGPLYYWQLIFFSMLFPHPFAPWIYLAILSTVFVYLMYKIGNQLYGPIFGCMTAFLAAISASQLSSAKGLSNPNMIGFFTALALFFTLKAISENKYTLVYGVIIGLTLGIGMNCHYQMMGMLFLPLMLCINGRKMIKVAFIAYCCIALTFIPLILFDLNNHWYTLGNMYYFYTEGRKAFYFPNRWLTYIVDFWPNFWGYTLGISKIFSIVIIVFFVIASLYSMLYKKIDKKIVIIWISFGINFILLRYYWGERLMGYLQYYHPYILLFTSYVLFIFLKKNIFTKITSLVLSVILVFFMIQTSVRELRKDESIIDIHKRVQNILSQFPDDRTFALYSCKRIDFDRVQSIAYTLYAIGKLSDSGIKLGMPLDCEYPENEKVANTKSDSIIELQKQLYPIVLHTEAIQLDQASESAIYNVGYRQISPKTIYEATVRWWFRDQL